MTSCHHAGAMYCDRSSPGKLSCRVHRCGWLKYGFCATLERSSAGATDGHHTDAVCDIYIKVVPADQEDHEHGMCCKLLKAMCITCELATQVRRDSTGARYSTGNIPPCYSHHQKWGVRGLVIGCDCVFVGYDNRLRSTAACMATKNKMTVAVTGCNDRSGYGCLGVASSGRQKAPGGILYEAGHRHTGRFIGEVVRMTVVTPTAREPRKARRNEREATDFGEDLSRSGSGQPSAGQEATPRAGVGQPSACRGWCRDTAT